MSPALVQNVVCDGATNNTFDKPIIEDIEDEPLFDQEMCVIHRLNLALKDCDESPHFKTIIAKLKTFLNHFKNADFKRQQLEECCHECSCVFLQLTFPSDTRFYFWYDVVRKILSSLKFI